MTNIILKKIEPLLIRRLRQRAEQNERTIEAEIIAILVSVLTPPEPTQAEPNVATAINQHFAEVDGVELPALPQEGVAQTPDTNDFRLPATSSLLSNTDTWEGTDFEDCLETVMETRSQLHA